MTSTKRKIFFRTDGNSDIGMGHFMRSISLAWMLREDFLIHFATIEPNDFQRKELELVCDKWNNLSRENHFDNFLSLLIGDEIVVLDNYYYDAEYQQTIKNKGCKLVCIDDLHDKHFVADVIINHAESSTEKDYSIEPSTKLCLGNKYALLRPDFLMNFERTLCENDKERVLICFGGIDKYSIGIKMANWLLDFGDRNVISEIVVINNDSKELEKRGGELGIKVRFFRNQTPRQMRILLEHASIGILPASTVAIEACAMRLPFITGYFVDNQKDILKGFKEKGLALSLDDFLKVEKSEFFRNLKLIINAKTKRKLIQRMSEVLDKKSPDRLNKLFRKLY